MPLKLVLKPGEKIIINQAVLVNGGQKSELVIQNRASVLREKDILTEESANSPAKKIYFMIQLLYLFPEEHVTERRAQLEKFIQEFVEAAPSSAAKALDIIKHVLREEMYPALRAARDLMTYEEELLGSVS